MNWHINGLGIGSRPMELMIIGCTRALQPITVGWQRRKFFGAERVEEIKWQSQKNVNGADQMDDYPLAHSKSGFFAILR